MPTERRKSPRLGLAIPMRVQGFLGDGRTWEERTTTVDVSAGGVCFSLFHEADLGQVLLLSLPLPKRLRQHDLLSPTYRVYSLVRGVRRTTAPPRVAIMFFGSEPPHDFQERPGTRYFLPADSLVNSPAPQGLWASDLDVDSPLAGLVGEPAPPPTEGGRSFAGVPPAPVPGAASPEFQSPGDAASDRRHSPRVDLFVNFTLQLVDEWGTVLQEELTVADNVSKEGARVMTSMALHVGDVVLLREARGGFATRAEVRATTRVRTAIDRLHLRFLDRRAPDRLLK